MKLHQQPEIVQIATLLTVIGAEAIKVFSTLTFSDANRDRIQPVLYSFLAHRQPLNNVPFERYKFNSRMQEAGQSYDHYETAVRQSADRCEFETILADQILRDKLFSESRFRTYQRDCFAKKICHCRKLMKFVGRMKQ